MAASIKPEKRAVEILQRVRERPRGAVGPTKPAKVPLREELNALLERNGPRTEDRLGKEFKKAAFKLANSIVLYGFDKDYRKPELKAAIPYLAQTLRAEIDLCIRNTFGLPAYSILRYPFSEIKAKLEALEASEDGFVKARAKSILRGALIRNDLGVVEALASAAHAKFDELVSHANKRVRNNAACIIDRAILCGNIARADVLVRELLQNGGAAEAPVAQQDGDGRNAVLAHSQMELPGVGGMGTVKEALHEIACTFRNPEQAGEYGLRFGGGMLFIGPPGCGKDLAIEAFADALGLARIHRSLAEILDSKVSQGEKNLREMFNTAVKKKPSLIHLEEIDAIGGSREITDQAWARFIVTQLLTEFSLLERNGGGVLVFASTNAPWNMDIALRRSRRFKDVVVVGPPDLAAREGIFRIHTEAVKHKGSIDYATLAAKTKGISGADIAVVCELACRRLFAESLAGGDRPMLETRHLLDVYQAGVWANRYREVNDWNTQAAKHAWGKAEPES